MRRAAKSRNGSLAFVHKEKEFFAACDNLPAQDKQAFVAILESLCRAKKIADVEDALAMSQFFAKALQRQGPIRTHAGVLCGHLHNPNTQHLYPDLSPPCLPVTLGLRPGL